MKYSKNYYKLGDTVFLKNDVAMDIIDNQIEALKLLKQFINGVETGAITSSEDEILTNLVHKARELLK